jgi:hypothetical protein
MLAFGYRRPVCGPGRDQCDDMVGQAASTATTSPSWTAQRFGHVVEPRVAVGLCTPVLGGGASVNSVGVTEDGHSCGGVFRGQRRRAVASCWERSGGDG